MKNLLAFIAIFISFSCRANIIDNLKTDDDVRHFLKGKINVRDDFDILDLSKPRNEKLAGTKYLKLDLNGDGRTDLLVNGMYLFAVIDAGEGQFELAFIDRGAFASSTYILTNVDTVGGAKVIVRHDPDIDDEKPKAVYDTLVMRFDGFVEFDHSATEPHANDIAEISLSTSGCYGTCPIYILAIASDGTAVFNAIKYNDRRGNWQCEISKAATDSIFSLASYIRPELLKNEYRVNWTDDQTATLKITFTNGSTKTITDYGMIGTFGLERLYALLGHLRKTENWEQQ